MRIQENRINNKKVIQIYLSKQEENDAEIKSKIQEMEDRKENVVLFISGDTEINKALKEMVKIIRNETMAI